jgi:hypothetical protein
MSKTEVTYSIFKPFEDPNYNQDYNVPLYEDLSLKDLVYFIKVLTKLSSENDDLIVMSSQRFAKELSIEEFNEILDNSIDFGFIENSCKFKTILDDKGDN